MSFLLFLFFPRYDPFFDPICQQMCLDEVVYANGICAVYKKIVSKSYSIDPMDAAEALYEMMPESLKHYWWKTA